MGVVAQTKQRTYELALCSKPTVRFLCSFLSAQKKSEADRIGAGGSTLVRCQAAVGLAADAFRLPVAGNAIERFGVLLFPHERHWWVFRRKPLLAEYFFVLFFTGGGDVQKHNHRFAFLFTDSRCNLTPSSHRLLKIVSGWGFVPLCRPIDPAMPSLRPMMSCQVLDQSFLGASAWDQASPASQESGYSKTFSRR